MTGFDVKNKSKDGSDNVDNVGGYRVILFYVFYDRNYARNEQ